MGLTFHTGGKKEGEEKKVTLVRFRATGSGEKRLVEGTLYD